MELLIIICTVIMLYLSYKLVKEFVASKDYGAVIATVLMIVIFLSAMVVALNG